jgi:glycosyltransferase involved in cell wall biosynthesis
MADITLLATADWDHPLWTNKQHVALSLARLGHRVLYIESLGLRGVRAQSADGLRILRRLYRGLRLPRRVGANLWVWSPLVLPGARSPLATVINRWLFAGGLMLVRALLGLKAEWLWTYNPRSLAYLNPAAYRRIIYHCVDDIQAQPGMNGSDLDRWEQALCRLASVVFVTSPALADTRKGFNPDTYFYPNVADHSHFAEALNPTIKLPSDLLDIPNPRIGFVGAISAYKIDLDLIKNLAASCPHWSFVLIGPVGEGDPNTDVSALQSLANLYLLGAKPYNELPAWLAGIDVAILPLRCNSYTNSMFPMKFFEYLAAGRPVLATAIRSLAAYSKEAELVQPDVAAFRDGIARLLASDTPEKRRARSEFSRSYTYDRRTAEMLERIVALDHLNH